MPYQSINDLPEPVRNHLPTDAQEIYREAFNRGDDRWHDESRASRYAWGAVKKAFHKDANDYWAKGPS